MRYYYDYSFPIGNLTIEEDGHGICGIYFGTKTLEGEKKNTELIREAALQLSQYFDGRRKKFDLKLSYHGTEFQIKVWKALEKIPYGETCTYKDIAESVGIPKGCRAVGMANNRNGTSKIIRKLFWTNKWHFCTIFMRNFRYLFIIS